MIRFSEDCWLKTSVEFESVKEPSRLGAVVTNHGYSGTRKLSEILKRTIDSFYE